ncbi:MAG: hypothetical protein FWH22_11900 [Fibromonadales bacterium]|nr:hypothetical protein [Fibromonadales bacterium]
MRQEQATIFLPEPDNQIFKVTPPQEAAEDLQAQVNDLQTTSKTLQKQLVILEDTNKELQRNYEAVKSDLKCQQMRESKEEKNQKKLMLYSLGLSPIFHKLVEKKPDRRDLTKPALADLFKISVDSSPALKSLLLGLGETNTAKLPDNVCDIFWENLKILELTSPGGMPPTGNLPRLKKIIFESS